MKRPQSVATPHTEIRVKVVSGGWNSMTATAKRHRRAAGRALVKPEQDVEAKRARKGSREAANWHEMAAMEPFPALRWSN